MKSYTVGPTVISRFNVIAALSSLSLSDDLPDSISERAAAETTDILQPLPPPQWNHNMYR